MTAFQYMTDAELRRAKADHMERLETATGTYKALLEVALKNISEQERKRNG